MDVASQQSTTTDDAPVQNASKDDASKDDVATVVVTARAASGLPIANSQAAAPSHAALFQGLRWSILRNTMRVLLSQSLHRVLTILLCSAVVWAAIFLVSRHGFKEMNDRFHIPLDGLFMGMMLDFLFVALGFLLTFSTGIIMFSSLFSSPETRFLLSTPVPADHIFAYKYQGALAFSSWAFVLLGSPILFAYGLVVHGGAPLMFHFAVVLYFLGFILLPGSLGALSCLILVNILPRQKKQVLILTGCVLTVLFLLWAWNWYRRLSPLAFGTRDWFSFLLSELSLISNSWMPTHWCTRGLQAATIGDWDKTVYNLALVWSNGLFFYLISVLAAQRLFRRGYNRMASGGSLRKRYGGARIDRAVDRILFFLGPQTRLLFIKDFRTFRRDPAQWAQILIFLGLAVFYFFNMRRFYEREIGKAFQNGISLLTLTATAFLLCAYTGRFIFPMLSLEGRKFWILGLLPLNRDRLVWGKFAFSTVGAILVTETLVIFSDIMLGMPPHICVLHSITIGALSFALSGMSVGLGTCMPNFRENDPSKIAVGFGGTLNLVACLLLLLVVIALMALPSHMVLASARNSEAGPSFVAPYVVPAFVVGLAIAVAGTLMPLRAGIHYLRRMEF